MALVKSNRPIKTGRKLKQDNNPKARKWKYGAKYSAKKKTGKKEEKSAERVFIVLAT